MRHTELGLITKGQLHPRSLDGEGAEFIWYEDWLELTLTFREPTFAEQRMVESGVFEVTLNVVERIPFLCFRIFQVQKGEEADQRKSATLVLPWQECPFHLAQLKPDRLPAFSHVLQNPAFRLPLAVVLTDLESRQVRAVRQFSLNSFFSRSLVDALLQTFPYYTPDSYPGAVDRVFAKFPLNTIGDMARIRCRSED